MAMKLFDLIEQWFGDILAKNMNDKATSLISQNMNQIDQIDDVIDNLNSSLEITRGELEDLKKTFSESDPIVQNTRKNIQDLIKAIKEENENREKLIRDLAKQTNLTKNEINDIIEQLKLYGISAVNSSRGTEQFRNAMTKMSKSLGFDLKALSLEFFSLSSIIAAATDQIIKSNRYLIEYSRRVGGAINYKTLGFDVTGNNLTNTGSLSSITSLNNISEQQFFEALGGFSKGKIMGQDYSKSASDLQRFAVEQGRLIKLYGVAAGDVAKITEVSTQLYGVSIKQLNKEFADGARIAKSAGLNVQEYFKNLAMASELIGETYIKGGTQGLERLALFATRLNTSVDNLVKIGNNFKNISDIFEQQGKGVNLGLSNYAQQAGLLFAKTQLGLYEEANRIAITALSKDVQKYTDKDGIIDQRGIRALNEMGFDKQYIQLIQRTIQAQRKLGVSFEELTDISKLSAEKQMEYYEEMSNSATITEKLNKLWAQVKSVFLDPVASVLGPALRIVIDSLTLTFQTLYVVLKPFIYAFQLIGNQLTKISNKISAVSGFIEEKLRNIGISGEKTGETFKKLVDGGGNLLAAILALTTASYTAAAAQGLSGRLGNLGSSVGNLLGGRGKMAALGRFAGSKIGRVAGRLGNFVPKLLKGGGIGIAASFAGDAISSLGPKGGFADRAGGALTGAANGAMIGSFIPIIGNVVGGIVGGIIGAIGFKDIKKWLSKALDWLGFLKPIEEFLSSIANKISSWLPKDENAEEAKKIANQSYDTADVYSMLNNTLNQRVIDPMKAEKAQENLIDKISKPTIHVEQGLYGDAKVKLSGF